MGFKPIFEEERLFFKEQTGIDLPTDCWRNGSKIYLDFTQDKPLLQFKVVNKKIKITKDNSEKINQPQKKISELIEIKKDELNELWNYSVICTVDMINKYNTYRFVLSHSGGKDSTLIYEVWKEALKNIDTNINWNIIFANTSNETADTYKYIKQLPADKLKILNPKVGFYPWIKNVKHYVVPTVLMRNCCSTYKEGQVNKEYDKNENIIMVIGVRRFESSKRSKFKMIMDDEFQKELYGKNNMSSNLIRFAPVVDWKDEDVWLFLLMNNISYNRQYDLGFNRCGCLICPYQSDYIDLLTEKYYPSLWKRWVDILTIGYKLNHQKERLKYTLDEYLNGKWKTGVSKEYEITSRTPTKARIKELSEIKCISEKMAAKFFNKKCKCGKKLNPTELAMFYKTYGRFEDIDNDNRDLLCKKCFCKENNISTKEYNELTVKYRDDGCKLF